MTIEIATIPHAVPPAMAPVFELCPTTLYHPGPWLDVVVFDELPTVYDRGPVALVLNTGAWELEL